MNNNSVKYLQDINFAQLALAEKTEIKNLGSATTDLVISQSSSSRIKLMRENLTALYTLNISD
jgi:hypothetical protein